MRAPSMLVALSLVLGACGIAEWGQKVHIVQGTVLEVNPPDELVVDHEAIPGLMGAMVMPFRVGEPAMIADITPGDTIAARLVVEEDGAHLEALRVTGHGEVPKNYQPLGPAPLHAGDALPATPLTLTGGESLVLGPDQGHPVALSFLYTTCPMPEYCPAVVTKLQALQQGLTSYPDPRVVAVTIDPEHDTLDVLERFAGEAGADPAHWRFARAEGGVLKDLAARAALPILTAEEDEKDAEIAHGLRLLVLDGAGRLIERYDDNTWDVARVVSQLTTGAPAAGEP